MVEKTVKVCDLCKDRISKGACEICKKDCCIYCSKSWRVAVNNTNNISILFCKVCLNEIYKKDILEKIKLSIIEDINKGRIIDKLEETSSLKE